MPLYEYECTKCGHRFEVIQKFSDPARKSCPQCRGAVRKLLSAPAIQFKGSGWYETDYSGKGKKKEGGEAPGEGPAAAAKDDAGSAKSAPAKDAKDTKDTPAAKPKKKGS